jgi:hypothetical protein
MWKWEIQIANNAFERCALSIGVAAGAENSQEIVAMAKDAKPLEVLNANAKQTMATAYWAMDYYFDNLRKIVSSAPSGGTDFGEKLKGYAEENIAAMHDFIKQLTQAKDFGAVLRIQKEFVRSQFESFDQQGKNLGDTYAKSQFGTRDKSSP